MLNDGLGVAEGSESDLPSAIGLLDGTKLTWELVWTASLSFIAQSSKDPFVVATGCDGPLLAAVTDLGSSIDRLDSWLSSYGTELGITPVSAGV